MDRTDVKVIGEMEDVLVHMAYNDKVCQVINIVVVDIPDAYGLVLSRDWSAKLNGYFHLRLVASVVSIQREFEPN